MPINFYLEGRVGKSGEAPIRVSITIAGARLLTSTGLRVRPERWLRVKQRVKAGGSNSQGATHAEINAALAEIADHFARLEGAVATGTTAPPSSTGLRREYAEHFGRGRRVPDAGPDLWRLWDVFAAQSHLAPATQAKFAALRRHLRAYKPDLDFADVTPAWLDGLADHLCHDCGMVNTTIVKQINLVKWFLRWALREGHTSCDSFRAHRARLKTTAKQVIYLEWDELMRVYHYDIPANGTAVQLTDADGKPYTKTVHNAAALAKTRDMFCFCALTSLRYSDAAALLWSNVGDDTLTITTIKTADTLTIEINKYARAILDKYRGRTDTDGHVFPHLSNQKMNQHLKHLGELCGINRPVTQTYYHGRQRIDETAPKYALMSTHCARRTFVCNALMLGIPADIVMQWTGHSDYHAMRPYIAIADAARAKAMTAFDQL